MDVSIIIVNYNTKKVTAECVISCLNEGSKISREIIIIDNRSTDGSVEFLKNRFKTNKQVIILENKTNEGFSKAVNKGLTISKGTYKYLLNSDTVVPKLALSKLVSFTANNESVGVVGTKLELPGGTIQKSCFNSPTIDRAISEYWFGKAGAYSPFYRSTVSKVDAVVGASFFISPKAFKKVGLFDERYFMFFEDLDYCRRVRKCGLSVYYLPEVKVFHYHGLSGKEFAKDVDQWRRLVPSSKIYHGPISHMIISFILWSGTKFKNIFTK